jgi:hypothetical protein
MMRNDFEKLLNLLENLPTDGCINFLHFVNAGVLQIFLANHHVAVDIYPFDYYHKRIVLSADEEEFTKNYGSAIDVRGDSIWKEEIGCWGPALSYQELRDVSNSIIMQNNESSHDADIFRGIEYWVKSEKLEFGAARVPHEWIFPLQRLNFEGHMFLAPRNPVPVLELRYGSNCLYQYPPDMYGHHGYSKAMTRQDLVDLEDFVNADVNEVYNELFRNEEAA